MKHLWKVTIIFAVLSICMFVLAGCEDYHKTGNRITGGKDVQTFTYCYVVLGGQEVARGAVA